MKYILTITAEFQDDNYLTAMETALNAAQAVAGTHVSVTSVVHKPQAEIKQPYTLINGTAGRPQDHNLLAVGQAE